MKNRTVFSGVQMNWLALAAGVFCLTMASGVSAEERDKPCAKDADRLCQNVEKGEGRVLKCLKEHSSELSSACKENMGKMREKREERKEKREEMKEACEADKDKLCKGTEPGEGRILKCLKQHEKDLSAACKEQMAHTKGKKQ